MIPTRIVAAAILVAISGCRSTPSALPPAVPECVCATESSPAASAIVDPFAPVLVPGPDRPRAMRSKTLPDIGPVSSAVPFRPPSAEHAQGTLLLARASSSEPVRIIEIDVAGLDVVRVHELSARGSSARIAATPAGVVVLLNDSEETESVFVLDPELKLRATLSFRGRAGNVHAGGELAVVGIDLDGSSESELTVLELPSGKVVAKRRLHARLADEWVPSAQVLIRGDRIFALLRGDEHYLLQSFTTDLGKRLAEARLPGTKSLSGGPCGLPGPHYGDGSLASTPSGVLVVRDGSLDAYDMDLRAGLPLEPGLDHFPELPAIDAATGRVLFATGDGAASLSRAHTDLAVAFRRDVWKWSSDGEVPLSYDQPVSAFFIGGRGVIVTKHPNLRLTVLEWDRD